MTFEEFFTAATGNRPYGYQCRLGCGSEADPKISGTLRNGTPCQSQLINIPTGLGKTAAVHRRGLRFSERTPSERQRQQVV